MKFKTCTTKWSTKRPKTEQEDRPSVQAQNILILEYTTNCHKIGKCSPYGMNQVPNFEKRFKVVLPI